MLGIYVYISNYRGEGLGLVLTVDLGFRLNKIIIIFHLCSNFWPKQQIETPLFFLLPNIPVKLGFRNSYIVNWCLKNL